MRFLDSLLARLGLVTGRRPHNPALDKELQALWHIGSDGSFRDLASGDVINRPMRPRDLLPRGPLTPSAQNDALPAEHDGAPSVYARPDEPTTPYVWYSLEEIMRERNGWRTSCLWRAEALDKIQGGW